MVPCKSMHSYDSGIFSGGYYRQLCNDNDLVEVIKMGGTKTTIQKNSVQETLVIPLYARKVRKLFQAMETTFPSAVLVFDSAGKKAVKMMIKGWVEKSDIKDVNAYFCVNNVHDDLEKWLLKSDVTSRGYMLGYHNLKDPSVSALYRLLAKIGDRFMKMKIVKISFRSKEE